MTEYDRDELARALGLFLHRYATGELDVPLFPDPRLTEAAANLVAVFDVETFKIPKLVARLDSCAPDGARLAATS